MTVLLVSFAIVLVAAVIQALTGFGFALVAVPLLALVTDPRNAVVVGVFGTMALAAVVAVRARDQVKWTAAAGLVGASLVGMPIGLLVLLAAPERLLTGLIAVSVLVSTVLVWRGLRLRHGGATIAAAGVVSGVLTTSTGTAGPPLVIALQAMGYDAHKFRATAAVVFTVTGLIAIMGLVVAAQVSGDVIAIGLIGLPALLVGGLFGNALFRRIDPAGFRSLVLGLLALTAAVTFLHALAG